MKMKGMDIDDVLRQLFTDECVTLESAFSDAALTRIRRMSVWAFELLTCVVRLEMPSKMTPQLHS
jgi:hypothetical protein